MGQTSSVKLRYTLLALADLREVLDYVAAHSPQGARRVQARLQAVIDLLLLYPNMGRRTNDSLHPSDEHPALPLPRVL